MELRPLLMSADSGRSCFDISRVINIVSPAEVFITTTSVEKRPPPQISHRNKQEKKKEKTFQHELPPDFEIPADSLSSCPPTTPHNPPAAVPQRTMLRRAYKWVN